MESIVALLSAIGSFVVAVPHFPYPGQQLEAKLFGRTFSLASVGTAVGVKIVVGPGCWYESTRLSGVGLSVG